MLPTDTDHNITLTLSLGEWVKLVLFGVMQLLAVGAFIWKAAWTVNSKVGTLQVDIGAVRTKVDEVIGLQLEAHDRRINRIEDRIFPTNPKD